MKTYRWLFTPAGDAVGCLLFAVGHFAAGVFGDWQPAWARLLLLLLGLWWAHNALTNWPWYDRRIR